MGEPLDAIHAPLRGEVGLLALAKDANHVAHLSELARSRFFDDFESVYGGVGLGCGKRAPAWA